MRGGVYAQAKRYADAIAAFERANVLSGNELSTWGVAHLAYGYAVAGQKEKAREPFDCLERSSKTTYVSPYLLALVSANLRNVDSAFEWLELGYAEKNPMLAFLRVDTLFDSLRSDPRFQDLIGRMKFPSETRVAYPIMWESTPHESSRGSETVLDHPVETAPELGGKPEICLEPATKTIDIGRSHLSLIRRIEVRLRGPSGPVVLFREGRLAKLREELVEAI